MNTEQILNSVKGKVIDFDMTSNATIFALIESEKGNYSIRQAFRNVYGEYKCFKMVKMLSKMGKDVAELEFADFIANMR